MHAAVITEPTAPMRNGSSPYSTLAALLTKANAVTGQGTHEMDMDQILQILMQLQKEGAARDVKLDSVIAGLKEINEFRVSRTAIVDQHIHKTEVQMADFARRLGQIENANLSALADRVELLEKSGIRGWIDGSAAKRIATLAGLVIAVGGAIAVVTALLNWLKAHLHF